MTRDLTEGSPLKKLIIFALPMLFGNLFQQLYSLADTAIVGRSLGSGALAAVGSTGSLQFMVLGFALGLCLGFTIPVSRAFGAKDIQILRRYVANIIILTVIISVIMSIAFTALAGKLLEIMQTPPDIINEARTYIAIMFAGTLIMMAYNILANLSRALGDSRTPLIFLIMATIINIGLDFLFILGFHTGVGGAAVATLISQLLSSVACFIYMGKRFPELHVRRADFKPDMKLMGELLFAGIPMALQFSITAIGTVVMQSSMNPFGSAVVAASTAGSKVQMIITTPFDALGMATATYASQNLGAKRMDRVRQGINQLLLLSLGVAIVGFFIATKAGPALSMLFLDASETEILANVKEYLFFGGSALYALAVLLVLRNAIQGLGYSVPAMTAGLFELVARSAVGLVLVRQYGFRGVCFSNPSAWVAALLFLIPCYIYVVRKLSRPECA